MLLLYVFPDREREKTYNTHTPTYLDKKEVNPSTPPRKRYLASPRHRGSTPSSVQISLYMFCHTLEHESCGDATKEMIDVMVLMMFSHAFCFTKTTPKISSIFLPILQTPLFTMRTRISYHSFQNKSSA